MFALPVRLRPVYVAAPKNALNAPYICMRARAARHCLELGIFTGSAS